MARELLLYIGMRVYKNKYYILKHHPGISGFIRWNENEYRVCSGYKASSNKSCIVKEFKANGRGQFRLEDGHVPEHQPLVKEKEIFDWIDINLYQTAFILNPEVYNL